MFMVKDEFTNIKNLLRVRIKTQAKSFGLVFILLTLIVFVPFVGTVTGIVRSDLQIDFIRFYNISDFSITLLFAIGIAYFAQMLTYRRTSDELSVYPQTNNSRFISSLLLNFIGVIALASFALVTYLIRYSIIGVLSVFMDNVQNALNFRLDFLVAGFFVYIAYSLLLVAIIELVGVILRKWTYYAIVAFTAALSLFIANISTAIERVSNLLTFLTEESSLIIFFLKTIILFLTITAISVVINRYTVYYKNHGRVINKGVVMGCIIITVAVTLVLPAIFIRRAAYMTQITTQRTASTEAVIRPAVDSLPGFEEIRIDISHLPNGSNIEVRVEDRSVRVEVVTGASFSNPTPVNISGEDSLRNIQGDTLIISYRPSFFHANGLMLSDFTDSQLIARLDGSVLFVDYAIENVQVVILPIWGIARQFDFFRDRNIFRANMIGMSAGGNIAPSVWFRVE